MRRALTIYLAGAAMFTAGALFVRLVRTPTLAPDGVRLREPLHRTFIQGPSQWEELPQRLRERGLQ